ncbi:MAG TPA: serine/threonine-protein kinase, partial [Polyangia bacterium]|nr:serine/threonine-protein kinase [Polyangia bacterium]
SRADPAATEGGRGRDLPSGLAVAGGTVVLPGLRSEERLLLGLVDGHLSVARLARLAGLSEEATLQHLQSLCNRRMLVPVETGEITIRGNSGEPFFRLGAYEVASRLGQGGMGSVYVCRRTGAAGFRRLFALKVVRQGSGQEQAAEKSFLREVRVGVLFDHPNTQSLIDVGMYKNQPFLVLQYIEGVSLEEISFGRRVPPEVVVTILIDVLRGLQRAHEIGDEEGTWLGLVHGDVSAPNILVGVDGVARLTDFGSARFTALGEARDPMTLGKPAYMAPEQLTLEPLDARTDLFAIGTVMWTALTGRELFAAESYEEIIANVLQKEVEAPSTFGAPACLDDICLRALSRSREGRPASAGAMAQALLKVGFENGLLASPAAVGEYVRREVTDADLERRRRFDAAFREGGAAGPAPASEATVTVSATPAGTQRKFSQTMPIPDRARRLVLAQRWLKSRGAVLAVSAKRWLRGDGVIFVALGVALAVLAAMATVAIVRHKIKLGHHPMGPSAVDAKGRRDTLDAGRHAVF